MPAARSAPRAPSAVDVLGRVTLVTGKEEFFETLRYFERQLELRRPRPDRQLELRVRESDES